MPEPHRETPRKLGDARHHMILVRDMARVVGADLELAQREGVLSPEDWAETITRCRGCTNVQTCETWLENERHGVDRRPPVCENARFLKDLAEFFPRKVS